MPETRAAPLLYGIVQCDQVRRARRWLEAQHTEYQFIDIAKTGLDEALVRRWLQLQPWERLVNRQSTTWRALEPAQRPVDAASAIRVLGERPTLLKRPLLEYSGQVLVGFSPETYTPLFAH